MRSSLREKAERLPVSSGVYCFRSPAGEALYIGKAVNLRARLQQYLSGSDERSMIPRLLREAEDLDFFSTHSEQEALMLEAALIRQHQPRYNVQLKDYRGFFYLLLDAKHPWPRYRVVRGGGPGKRFGPYFSYRRAQAVLELVQRLYPLRTCTDRVLKGRRRPCLLEGMGRCVAPCVEGFTSPEAYRDLVAGSVKVLEGRDQELRESWTQAMWSASEEERFEEAAKLRDRLQLLSQLSRPRSVVDAEGADRDYWALWMEGAEGVLTLLPMREGVTQIPQFFSLQMAPGEAADWFSSQLNAWYDIEPPPPEVLVDGAVRSQESLQALLTERRGRRVYLHRPGREEDRARMGLARRNAQRWWQHRGRRRRRSEGLERLAKLLQLPSPPHRMECYDNSHLSGESPSSAQVVFLDGEPETKLYRHYHLKRVKGGDDFDSMREVLSRRLRRGLQDGDLPDLIVVDGGWGQLSAAEEMLETWGLDDLPLIAIAKPHGQPVDRLMTRSGEELILDDRDPALNLVRHARDEAHRFSLRLQRQRRSKKRAGKLKPPLERVQGLGASRRRALLSHFGGMEGLEQASERDLQEVPGIGPQLAARIIQILHPG